MADACTCVDLGTNTCLALVAREDGGQTRVLADLHRIVRLGEGVDRHGVLLPAARERTLETLREYAAKGRALGVDRGVVVATSAMRDARDGPAFADEIRGVTGFRVQIISGDEEARLAWLSVASEPWLPAGPRIVFDVGGGSTEVIHGTGARMERGRSFNVGSVRLAERVLRSDPATPDQLAELARLLAETLAPLGEDPRGASLVGLAGTVTTLACLAQGRPTHDARAVHGSTLDRATLQRLRATLGSSTLAERLRMPALEPGRADVISAGVAIVDGVMEATGASVLHVADRGVRWGLWNAVRAGDARYA